LIYISVLPYASSHFNVKTEELAYRVEDFALEVDTPDWPDERCARFSDSNYYGLNYGKSERAYKCPLVPNGNPPSLCTPGIPRGSVGGHPVTLKAPSRVDSPAVTANGMDIDDYHTSDQESIADGYEGTSGLPILPPDADLWLRDFPSYDGRVPIFQPPPIAAGAAKTKSWAHYLCVFGSEIQAMEKERQPAVDELVFRTTTSHGHGSCTKMFDRENKSILFFPSGVTVPVGCLNFKVFGFICPIRRYFRITNPGRDVELFGGKRLAWLYPSSMASSEHLRMPRFSLPPAFEIPLTNPLIVPSKQVFVPIGILVGSHQNWAMKDYEDRLPDAYYEPWRKQKAFPVQDQREENATTDSLTSPQTSSFSNRPPKDSSDRSYPSSHVTGRLKYQAVRKDGYVDQGKWSSRHPTPISKQFSQASSSDLRFRSRSRSNSSIRRHSRSRSHSPPRRHRSPSQLRRSQSPTIPSGFEEIHRPAPQVPEWKVMLQEVESRYESSLRRRDQDHATQVQNLFKDVSVPLSRNLAEASKSLADSLKTVSMMSGRSMISEQKRDNHDNGKQIEFRLPSTNASEGSLLSRMEAASSNPAASTSSEPVHSIPLLDRMGPSEGSSSRGRKSKSTIKRRKGHRA
jgi:hypothetical protein